MFAKVFTPKKISLAFAASSFFLYSYSCQSETSRTKTFIWGNGSYQARPDTYVQFNNFEPKLIKSFDGLNEKPNMRKIFFGDHHEGGIDTLGNAYLWKKHILYSSVEKEIDDNVRQEIINLDESKSSVQLAFTRGFVWLLKKDGNVFQWPINVKYDNDKEEIQGISLGDKRHVTSLKNIVQIAAGNDHFVALNKEGDVLTMGDDTYGQCGIGPNKRSNCPPYFEKRIRKPEKVQDIPQISKIVAGTNHTLALSNDGIVYGWGSNSNLQLSHQLEFGMVENPLLASFSPIRIDFNLENSRATDIAAGNEFSIFVTENRRTAETEVFGCGHNIHGEIGAGFLKHITDVVKLESLSNFKIKTEGGERDVRVKQISCGYNHCMALLSVGVIMEWGANEYGQLGNKKRAFLEHPAIVGNFTKENVVSISCGQNNSAVIVENLDGGKEKK